MTESSEPEIPEKEEPASLELRAKPRRAIRLRGGIVIGGTAIASVLLVAIAWMALQPKVVRQIAQAGDLARPNGNAAPDTLANLPAGYGDVPKLGPPLPGDLGRPILRAQERGGSDTGGILPAPTIADRRAAREQERAEELTAARRSGLLFRVTSERGGASAPPRDDAPAAQSKDTTALGTTRKEQFANQLPPPASENAHRLVRPSSVRTLLAGSVIPASLITGLNSDLPGMVTAQVTQNVFDTVTGSILLIPQGARLIGQYDSVVAFGQQRALVVWQRLILPDGSSLQLDNMFASDPSGYAGIADKVDFHTWQLLKGVTIATMLGVGSELTFGGEGGLVEALRRSAQTNTARAGDQIVQRNLDIQPTVTVRPGTPLRVLITRDLVLEP